MRIDCQGKQASTKADAAGPGLAVRILGDVTEGDKLEVLRQVDEIFVNTISDFGLYDEIWQAFAVFLPVKYALFPPLLADLLTLLPQASAPRLGDCQAASTLSHQQSNTCLEDLRASLP